MRPYLDRATEPGVVAIGAAQEFQSVFTGYDHATKPGAVCFGFSKAERRVTVYYFYVLDREFGPGFIKLCSYFPYPGKVWVNGHEWAKTQADRARLAYIPLANGFASCSRPEVLQGICDRLGPADVQAFFDRWIGRIPPPLRRCPARGVLVGALVAPDRGFAHRGVRPAPPGPSRLRGHRRRHPRPR